jgi:hypothetical protein
MYNTAGPTKPGCKKHTTTKSKRTRHVGFEAAVVLDPDDMQHEIYSLKKERVAFQQANRLMQTKIATLEKELKAAYQLAQQAEEAVADALNGGGGGGGTATVGGKRASEGRLVAGLKRNVRELRTQLNQQDSQIQSLQSDIRLTDIEEARLEARVNYEEVMRLRIMLEQLASGEGGVHAGGTVDATITPSIQTMRKLKETSRVLDAENAELRLDLEAALHAAYQLREDGRSVIYAYVVDFSKVVWFSLEVLKEHTYCSPVCTRHLHRTPLMRLPLPLPVADIHFLCLPFTTLNSHLQACDCRTWD